MRIKLIHKLLALNVGIILVLTLSLVILSYHFSGGMFSSALNGIDREVMEQLSKKLEQHYNQKGSWEVLVSNQANWKRLVNHTFFDVFFDLMKDTGHPIPPPNPGLPSPDEDFMAAGPGKTGPEFGSFLQRCTLLDAEKKVLIPSEINVPETSLERIRVNGSTVGYLQVGKIEVDFLPLAQYFFNQQMKIIYWSMILGGAVAAVLSFFLSRHLTSPIQQLIKGARKIAKREFDNVILISSNDELEELAESFNSVARELAAYRSRQREWLTHISHELKAPLTVLVGEIYAVCDNLSSCNEQTITLLQEEVDHVKRLADDLFEMSKMDEIGLKFRLEETDLQEVLDSQLRHYHNRFSKLQFQISVEHIGKPLLVMGDADRLAQVISNIFENCIRYSQKPGQITIRFELEEESIALSVEDSGPGVAEETLPKLFDRYYCHDKIHPSNPRGAGLGLAICKEIIEAHNGSIVAKCADNSGLIIRITLPIYRILETTNGE